jgi:hypothetical protein
MRGFLVDASTTPEACPEGHRIDDPELTAEGPTEVVQD